MTAIKNYEIFMYAYDLGGYKLSYGRQDEVDAVIVIIENDEGERGYGEANPWQPFTKESASDVFDALKNRLLPAVKALGCTDPWRVQQFFDETPEDDLIAKGAINVALMDLEGKRRECAEFCVNGSLAGNCRKLTWKHDVYEEARRTEGIAR